MANDEEAVKLVSRREALAVLLAAGSAAFLPDITAAGEGFPRKTSMGIVSYAFGIHQKNHWAGRYTSLGPALALLEEAHRLGAGGIMADLGADDTSQAAELRTRAERYGMYFEASLMPPKTAEEVPRFEKEIQLAKTAGAALARTTIMPGRRYEQFKSLEEFRDFQRRGRQSLELAAPVLAREKFRLAVENHKDQRISEKLETLKQVGSEWIGICLDVGNSFTLLEDPLETARAFAPLALTVHLKDQAIRENAHGFWFADAPLGAGFLDLQRIIGILREANPQIHFGLETITRDALDVPLLEQKFWRTLPEVTAAELARTLGFVKAHSQTKPFPAVSKLSVKAQMALELRNVSRSIEYAQNRLGLA